MGRGRNDDRGPPGAYDCKFPINGSTHGTCMPPAEGCEDLGTGIAVLPEPWSQYTQLCSNDGNCDGIAISLNVGELIRDLAGTDEIMGVEIQDATVNYDMSECAEVKLTQNISCGICVPCQEDADCDLIGIDPLIKDLFSGNPLAQIAGVLLIDMLWGDNTDHSLNFYCQPVALGYGVCAPCSNPLQSCASGGGGGSGTCEHDVCTQGTPLDPSCGACADAVCNHDQYCCITAWDSTCVNEVDMYCSTPCGGGGGCSADICTDSQLAAQDASCGPCVEAVCQADPFCCNKVSGSWDQYCVSGANANAACAALCSGGGCAHSECATGGSLDAECSPCATAVCSYDNWCCTVEWDSQCVDEAVADSNCSCII